MRYQMSDASWVREERMVKKGLRSCHVNGGGSAGRSHGNINRENYAKSGCAAKPSEIQACPSG